MVVDQCQVTADFPFGTIVRPGIKTTGNGFHDGVDDATTTRRVAGRDRCQHELGEAKRISNSNRSAPNESNKVIADTRTESRFDQSS